MNSDELDDSFAAKAELDIQENSQQINNQKSLIEDPAKFHTDQSLNFGAIEFAYGIGPSTEKQSLNDGLEKNDQILEAPRKQALEKNISQSI